MIICWLSLLPELIEPSLYGTWTADCVAAWIQFDLAHRLSSIRAMAFCDCERWIRLTQAFVVVNRDTLLDLLRDLILDNSYSALEV